MAISQVQIVNLALTKLGQNRVINITDDTETARTMNSLWDVARDTVFADHPWKFAIKRAELPALTSVPAFGWTKQYTIPEESLRIVQVADDWVFYQPTVESFAIEDGKILTDMTAPLPVRYVRRLENTGLWPVLFARVVALQLAVDACERLTNSNTKLQAVAADYSEAVRAAKRQNAIERPPQAVVYSDWLNARGD